MREGFLGRRRGPLAAAALTALVALVALAVLVAAVIGAARRDAEETFVESAEQTAAALEQQLRTYLDELRDIGAFAANAESPSPEQFRGFVEGTGIFDQLPSLVGVLFLHRVPVDRMDDFVAQMQEAIPGFSIFELGPSRSEVHYVLTYYVPGSVDLQLPIGTDVTPIAAITGLVTTQGDRGEAIAGSFQEDPYLRQVADDTDFEALGTLLSLDFFLGVPAFSSGADGQPPGELIGWVGAPVDDFDDVLAAASADQPEDLGLSLTIDLTDTGYGERADLERAAVQPGGAGDRDDAAFELTRELDVDGVDFTVAVWSSPGADNLPPSVPVVVAGGAVVTLLAAAVVYLRLRTRQRDELFTRELRDREEAQRDILDSVSDAMVVLDRDGRLVGANPAWWRMCGPDVVGDDDDRDDDGRDGAAADLGGDYASTMEALLRGRHDELAASVRRVLDAGAEAIELDVPVGEGAGHRWYAVRMTPLHGRRGGAVVVHSDITDRKRSHDELQLRATRDDLTGLLNRPALEAEIDGALARARARGQRMAVLFVDLDGFKAINDEHGHTVGDEVLRAVARRLATAVRSTDRVARFGGDEFVVLVGPLDDPAVAEQTAARILRAFEAPMRVERLDLAVRVSVGVAVVDAAWTATRESLIEAADRAMYQAKQLGGGRAMVAAPERR